MICIYHNRDFDGFCSAAIIRLKYPDAKFIGWDYGMPLTQFNFILNEPVIMVDISFSMGDMYELAKKTNWQLTWIDHHKSAIKDFNEFVRGDESFCRALLDSSISACEATWKYCFPDQIIPRAVGLLGIYDTWRRKDDPIWDEKIMPFQMGLRLISNSLENFPNAIFTDENLVNEIIEHGLTIIAYQDMQNESRCKSSAFERVFEGLRAVCLIGVIGSQSFKSVWDVNKYDIMIAASYTRDKWTVSLYTEKLEIDVSVICKKYGGGGHKGAAGFVTNDISFLINN